MVKKQRRNPSRMLHKIKAKQTNSRNLKMLEHVSCSDLPIIFVSVEKREESYQSSISYIAPSIKWARRLHDERSILELFDDNSKWHIKHQLERSAIFELPITYEARLDGEKDVYVSINLNPVINDLKVLTWSGMIVDITEKKMHEISMQQEKAFLEELFEVNGNLLCTTDLSGNLLRYNESFKSILGFEDVVLSADEFWPGILDAGAYELLKTKVKQLDRKSKYQSVTTNVNTRYGQKTIAWTLSKVKLKEDESESIVLSGVDITLQRKTEHDLNLTNEQLKTKNTQVERVVTLQETLFSIFEQLRNTKTHKDVYELISTEFASILEFRNLFICLKENKRSDTFNFFDLNREFTQMDKNLYFVEQKGILGQVINKKEAFFSGDVKKEDTYIVHDERSNSILMVPIVFNDFLWGVIGLDSTEYNAYDVIEIDMIKLAASHISLYFEELESKNELVAEASKLRKLHDAFSCILNERTDDEIADHIIGQQLLKHLAVYRSFDDDLSLVSDASNEDIPLVEDYAKAFVDHAMTRTTSRIQTTAGGTVYHLSHPVVNQEEVLGVLYSVKVTPFIAQETNIIAILADQLAVYWRLNQMIVQSKREALIDPLMDIWNRRYMIRCLEEEDARIKRYDGIASIALIDLGNFKEINDTYGHIFGDQALKIVARVLKANMRETDSVGRYGGDEFLILMPNTGSDEAQTVLERITEELNETPVISDAFFVTADYGIATIPEDTFSMMDGIRVADERMYRNKRSRKGKFIKIDME
ncbi:MULTISPECIES: sensor domain-containing diguanylate cyclase [unclassified Fusibacter]|uniref:sensor domain-containing diguanylate cyclase n=1 Tax=unclassified Fusibacter TaxID=2624464 RepID=UPI001011ACE7|nr:MULTISPECIES: sensor domain-containing diguanylate cyclase [unclassified Fusibacter]MCK8061304.1 sensor domain-containing diguanylate cyclase [Fusibacter sp. A2]NPE23499.1 sensor domain-containing diguanylate cyclase [Fusibacter sp. A1]RXV59105.1 sensor domain-containing diguanylate cyclase [Fusibacter sp. A1]